MIEKRSSDRRLYTYLPIYLLSCEIKKIKQKILNIIILEHEYSLNISNLTMRSVHIHFNMSQCRRMKLLYEIYKKVFALISLCSSTIIFDSLLYEPFSYVF